MSASAETTTLRLGLALNPSECAPEQARAIARRAEQLGFTGIWLFDHFFFSHVPLLECWTTLCVLARATQQLRIAPFVLCNSYRPPALVAKMAATLDHISDGRLDLGLGAGWHEREYRAYGIPFPPPRIRVKQLREALILIKRLWTEDRVTFRGRFYHAQDAVLSPKPVQHPHPPVWIGGHRPFLLRVAAEHAQGVNIGYQTLSPAHYARTAAILQAHCRRVHRDPNGITQSFTSYVILARDPEQVRESVRRLLRKLARTSGRQPLRFLLRNWRLVLKGLGLYLGLSHPGFLIAGTPDQVAARLAAFRDLGARYFILHFPISDNGDIEGAEQFHHDVWPQLLAKPLS